MSTTVLSTDADIAIASWLRANGPVTESELRKEFNLTQPELFELMSHERIPSGLVLGDPGRTGSSFSDEEILQALRGAWDRLRSEVHGVTSLSVASYDRVRLPEDPSPALVTGRYPWRKACELAGVPSGTGREVYHRLWSDEDLLTWVGRYAQESNRSGTRPTFDGFDAWRRTRQGAPSGALVRQRLRRSGFPTWAAMVLKGLGMTGSGRQHTDADSQNLS